MSAAISRSRPNIPRANPLAMMMKPGMGHYDKFKEMFEHYSKLAGKKQYLIPYFIAAHPGTRDEDMMNLALWLKAQSVSRRSGAELSAIPHVAGRGHVPQRQRTRCARSSADSGGQAIFSGQGHSARDDCTRPSCATTTPPTGQSCREALKRMGRADLIGPGKQHLIPNWQPPGTADGLARNRKPPRTTPTKPFRTQHTRPATRG